MPWNKTSAVLKGPKGDPGPVDLPANNGPVPTIGGTRKDVGVESGYAAFPGMCKLADGRLLLVWREGSDHVNARDGKIYKSYSSDNGNTWTAKAIVLSDTRDYRDPSVTCSKDGKTVWLTYFTGSSTNSAEGAFIRISKDDGTTFGNEIRIDNHQYAAIASPVIELESGAILATWYGKINMTDARNSVWTATSANGGETWTAPALRVDGIALDLDMEEPWPAKQGNNVVIMHRHGNASNIDTIYSTNDGVSWQDGAAFSGSGRPSCVITENGTLITTYRQWGSFKGHGMMRYSYDLGKSWGPDVLLEEAYTGWMYSSPVEVMPNTVLVPTSIENGTATSTLSCRYIVSGTGNTPYGDNIPGRLHQIADGRDEIGIADYFNRPNSTSLGRAETGQLWNSTGGAVISDGKLYDNSASGVQWHIINCFTDNYEIEADFMWAGNPGFGIVFRYVNSTNHLLATIENAGQNARLYRITSTGATALMDTAIPVAANIWSNLKVSSLGSWIRFYVDGELVGRISDTTNNTSRIVGIRTNTSTASHYHLCNKFILKRKSPVRYGMTP